MSLLNHGNKSRKQGVFPWREVPAIHFIIASWFHSGRFPFASGTFGSLAALPFAVLFVWLGSWQLLTAASVIICIIGWWSSEKTVIASGREDPSVIVVDEVAGQWITLIAAPLDPITYFVGFLLFRAFDIFKPWPACWADSKLKGGLGIMLDDVFAGIYAALVLQFMLSKLPPDGWNGLIKVLIP